MPNKGGKCPQCGHTELVVRQRNCNHSAFSGYHWTPSDYSTVVCLKCHYPWRSKARYVDYLRDENEEDLKW